MGDRPRLDSQRTPTIANDRDFWYNLPANFDVLDAAYRMFLSSDDLQYVTDPVFLNF
ncbi:MAG: hypothetical protein IPJ56_17905 [Gemmatimonadetes bacterium]|nr:hypothetical protein [Gemmatimonadota bacterium]